MLNEMPAGQGFRPLGEMASERRERSPTRGDIQESVNVLPSSPASNRFSKPLSMTPDELLAFTRMTGQVIQGMRECPLPIIAAVHGMAAGAGAVIALAADFRVCTQAAKFAFLFTKVGLSGADMGAAYLLPRLVGLGHATRLLMLGDTISADQASRIGLVSELVEPDGFDEAVDGLARRLASGPVQAYAQTKALLTREQDMSLSAAVELEAMTQALLMKGQDYAEFHAAFTAGRAPRWSGT